MVKNTNIITGNGERGTLGGTNILLPSIHGER